MNKQSYADFGIEIPSNRNSGNVKVRCPNCAKIGKVHTKDKCLSVNLDKGVWNCHKCGFSGCLPTTMKDVTFYTPQRTYDKPKRIGNPKLSPKVLHYLEETRCIPADVLEKYHITEGEASVISKDTGEWVKRNCIHFNYYLNGEHINTKFRSGFKEFAMIPKCRIVPYNIDSVLGKKKVIVTEGEADCLSFIAAGYDNDSCGVCSVPNGANSAKCFDDFIDTHFDDKEIIYIASDMDAPGIALREELLRRFGKENCKVITYGEGFKDANELLCAKGIGALIEAVNNAQDFPSDDVVTVDHLSDNLDVLFNEGLQRGKTIGIPAFDELISFETKRLCIVTGIPTMGKSTFLDEMCVRFSLNYGWRTAFFSPENEPLQLHMSKLISRIAGCKFDNQHITPQQYQRTKNYVAENFSWIKPQESYTLTNILKAAKWLVRRKGIKVLVIDPYNRVESEGNSAETETKYISTMLDRLTNFAQQYDVLVCLMAHPRKMPKDTNGKLEIPTMYDINGSANFYNKADFGIVVHRDKEQGVTIVKVDKVKFRHLGQGGRCNLYFNINNERYTDNSIYDNSDWLVKRHNEAVPETLDGFSFSEEEMRRTFAINDPLSTVPF